MEDYRKFVMAEIARAFRVPAHLLSADPADSAIEVGITAQEQWAGLVNRYGTRARNLRKAINRRRYERRFQNHARSAKRLKVRTEAQRARAITRQAIEVRRFARVLSGIAGFLQALRSDKSVQQMAVPRGKYHSATRKGPGRRPLRPRTEVSVCARGAKWLPSGFPRGY